MDKSIPVVPAFPVFPNITAFFTTRFGGLGVEPFQNMNLGFNTTPYDPAVGINWKRLASQFNLDLNHLKYLKQIHSNNILDAETLKSDVISEGDALYTSNKKSILAIFSADCLPLLIYDYENKTVAAVHAGLRGTQSQIIH